MKLEKISSQLAKEVDALQFAPPVEYSYNPLRYAARSNARYVTQYGSGKKEALLVGMNPGPFGMAQTGIPFGDISLVRDWIGIEEPVDNPPKTHPKRPVQGFACARSEVSGTRLWSWAKARFKTPDKFFKRFFVWNYCPLCFMESSGKNRTPDKLPREERDPLFAACNQALRKIVDELEPSYVIGVGKFAEKQIQQALNDYDITIGSILHPSPASPAANKGWAEAAEKQLLELGVSLP